MKVNLIDGSNIFFICWCVFMDHYMRDKDILTPQDEQQFFKIFFMKLRMFMDAKNNIIAFEGKNSRDWRRSIYPEYKANRAKTGEQKFGADFKRLLNQVIDMLEWLPCKVLQTENAEGDDIIYTMAKAFYNSENPVDITIVSTDADLTQICNYFENVKVFNPVKREFAKVDPNIVLKKTIVGDSSDNIKYKKGVGEATFRRMLESKFAWNWNVKSDEDFQRLKNIRTIVDLRCIPTKLYNSIIEDFNSKEWGSSDDLDEFFQFLFDNEELENYITITCGDYDELPGEPVKKLALQSEDETPPDVFEFVNLLK